ncbi:MAG TPA: DNA polymerase III subunit gamma/tau [Verrucomicrobiae bacterium]
MSYQVIARKYRPQKFDDVVGQEHVSQTLANAIKAGRIAHAYLFCGPRGTGKTTMARIFAKALNCTGGPKADFDVADPKCQEIADGRSLDVIEIDGASNNGVEQVRELRDTCRFAPASSKFKIYIIDEVHMLSTAAFNALLKTLEEPPAHVKFLFATTDPEKVLPTILSRCQRFDLRRIPANLIVKQLAFIAKEEGVEIDDGALYAIARAADGGMRDAESTLDQLISFCGSKIEEGDVLSMFGLTARSQLLALSQGVLAGEVDGALRELNALAKSGKDLGRLLSDLLSHIRNLMIYQVSSGDLSLLEVSEAEAVMLKEQAGLVNVEALSRILEVLTDAEGRLREAVSKKILIEVALLRAIQARNAVSIDSVLKTLNQLRGSGGGGGSVAAASAEVAKAPAAPAPAAAPKPFTSLREAMSASPATTAAPVPLAAPAPKLEVPKPAPISAPVAPKLEAHKIEAAPVSAPALFEEEKPAPKAGATTLELAPLWDQVVDAVARVSPFIKSYLLEAHPVSFNNGVFIIGYDPKFSYHLSLVDNSKNHALIQTKLKELGQGEARVKFIESVEPEGWERRMVPILGTPEAAKAAPASSGGNGAPAAKTEEKKKSVEPVRIEDFKNDPLIKKALEIFKGQIVDVRA